MKKIFVFFLLVILFFTSVSLADDEDLENLELSEIWNDESFVSSNSAKEPNLNSRSAVIIDRNTKSILFGKNENERRAMASTTKIMTAIICLENGNLNDIIEVSRKSCIYWWL